MKLADPSVLNTVLARPSRHHEARGDQLSSHQYLDEAAAADRLKSSRRRLKDLRRRGGGPPFVRLGAAVRYRTDWLDHWAEAQAVCSTSEETARRRA
jgi:hypothetical protein